MKKLLKYFNSILKIEHKKIKGGKTQNTEEWLKHQANKIKWGIELSKFLKNKHIRIHLAELNRIDKRTTKELEDIILELIVNYENEPINWDIPDEIIQKALFTINSLKKRKRSIYIKAIMSLSREFLLYLYDDDENSSRKEKLVLLNEIEKILYLFKFRMGKLGDEIFKEFDLDYLKKLKESLKSNNKILKEVSTFESIFHNINIIPILNTYLSEEEDGQYINNEGYWIRKKSELMGFVDALLYLSIIKKKSWALTGRLFSSYYNLEIDDTTWRDVSVEYYDRVKAKNDFIDEIELLKRNFEKSI